MRDFDDTRWSPDGGRPHVFLLPGPALQTLCDQVIAPGGMLDQWYPHWRAVTWTVAPRFRHATVAWADLPTAHLRPGTWEALEAAVAERVAGLDPVPLIADTLTMTGRSRAVRIDCAITEESNALADAVEAAFAHVFAPSIRTVIDRSPHIALAYGTRNIETPDLTRLFDDIGDQVGDVVLVDQDTYGPARGWATDTQKRLALRHTRATQR